MAKEIERKYLLSGDGYETMAVSAQRIVQGYLSRDPDAVVRIRIKDAEAFITVKSRNRGCVRNEWEYPIPVEDAREMLGVCTGIIEKVRYIVPYKGHIWEVDIFGGAHQGLKIAEIELRSAQEHYDLPPFVGEEVTGDARYYNSNLSS